MLRNITDASLFNELYCNNYFATSVLFKWIKNPRDTMSALNLYITYESKWSKQTLNVTFFQISRLSITEPFSLGDDLELMKIDSVTNQQIDSIRYRVVGTRELEDPVMGFLCNDFCAVLEDYSL